MRTLNELKNIIGISLFAMMFMACSNKDSNFASKYARNQSGANAVSAEAAALAAQVANSNGADIDVVSFDGPRVSGNLTQVNSVVVVNSAEFQIGTTMQQTASGYIPVSAKQIIGGLEFEVNATCSNDNCHFYYLMLTVRKNGQFLIQEGFKKELPVSNLNRNNDVYQFLGQGSIQSFQGMINLLDSYKSN